MKIRALVIILLTILLIGCSSYNKTQLCEYPTVSTPEPLWVPDVKIYYNEENNVFYMEEKSMRNLNIYLIDVHRYVKDTSNIIKLINEGANEK